MQTKKEQIKDIALLVVLLITFITIMGAAYALSGAIDIALK